MSTDDVIRDARKTARDAKDAASDKLADMQDDLIVYTREKPLIALLSAFAIGVLIGKTVL
jgi:hypothetical protein